MEFYWKQLKTAKQVEQNSIRNIMDMNANLGGFAAALRAMNMPVWVMNVVPYSSPNSLKVVYHLMHSKWGVCSWISYSFAIEMHKIGDLFRN